MHKIELVCNLLVKMPTAFHEKQCVVKFLCYIFSKWLRGNTEQFLFHGRIELRSVCYIEPTDKLLWKHSY